MTPMPSAFRPNAPFSQGCDCALSTRRFTDHEMMDDLGLVHMTKRGSAKMAQPSALRRVSRCGCPLGGTTNNGRIYDPVLGRFLSADPFVPNPSNLQDYNRYSYVRNNPLRFVDPSGFTPNVPDGLEDAREQARRAASQLNRMLGHLGGGVNHPMLGQLTAVSSIIVEIITTAASDNAQTATTRTVEQVNDETPAPREVDDVLQKDTPAPEDPANPENPGDSAGQDNAGGGWDHDNKDWWWDGAFQASIVANQVHDGVTRLIQAPDVNPMVNLAGMREKDDLRNLGLVSAQIVIPYAGAGAGVYAPTVYAEMKFTAVASKAVYLKLSKESYVTASYLYYSSSNAVMSASVSISTQSGNYYSFSSVGMYIAGFSNPDIGNSSLGSPGSPLWWAEQGAAARGILQRAQ